MATNTGRGTRVGAVRRRSQTFNPLTRTWTKRGTNGRFLDGKAGGAAFKGVRKEEEAVSALLIGYDLHRPGQNYEELISFLKSEGTWWHALDSTWLLVTRKTATEMRDEIKRHVDANDGVVVLNVTGDSWASFGLSKEANSWLNEHV